MLDTATSARHAHAFDAALRAKLSRDEWADNADEYAAELGLRSLDEFMNAHPDAQPIETNRHFERWHSGESGDEDSTWFCRDCGIEALGDHDDGCAVCGIGAWKEPIDF